MDFGSIGVASVVAITVLCYLIGEATKITKLDNKWIPVICGTSGLVLGIVAMHVMPDFPATDYITAAAVGTVSGLAATGFDQSVKQLSVK